MADFIGKSFIATLLCASEKETAPVDFLRGAGIAGSGWLVQGDQSRQVLQLRFDYISHTEDRFHYHISAAANTQSYSGAKLGVSVNGYLGFYQVAEVVDYWKLQLEGENLDSSHIEFTLRDHRGHRVGATTEAMSDFWTSFRPKPLTEVVFLNVDSGKEVFFQARVLKYL
jgi:hypothetical protein